jgi:DNA damage-binding protein 1
MLDLERNGQGAMLTCSGAYKDGSLRVVRNGIGVREEAAIDLPGIQGVWSLKDSAAAADHGADAFDKLLVQTFATETRVLALEADEEEGSDALQLAECEIPGFDAGQRTLLCANLAGGLLLQVTPASCRLVDGRTMQLIDEWQPPADALAVAGAGAKITVAAANSTQVLLAAGRVLLLLTLAGRKLQLHHHTAMDQEISCVDITPVSALRLGHSRVTHF